MAFFLSLGHLSDRPPDIPQASTAVFGLDRILGFPSDSQKHLLLSRATRLDQNIWQLTGPQWSCYLKVHLLLLFSLAELL